MELKKEDFLEAVQNFKDSHIEPKDCCFICPDKYYDEIKKMFGENNIQTKIVRSKTIQEEAILLTDQESAHKLLEYEKILLSSKIREPKGKTIKFRRFKPK